jgi:hypothetical protein
MESNQLKEQVKLKKWGRMGGWNGEGMGKESFGCVLPCVILMTLFYCEL